MLEHCKSILDITRRYKDCWFQGAHFFYHIYTRSHGDKASCIIYLATCEFSKKWCTGRQKLSKNTHQILPGHHEEIFVFWSVSLRLQFQVVDKCRVVTSVMWIKFHLSLPFEPSWLVVCFFVVLCFVQSKFPKICWLSSLLLFLMQHKSKCFPDLLLN